MSKPSAFNVYLEGGAFHSLQLRYVPLTAAQLAGLQEGRLGTGERIHLEREGLLVPEESNERAQFDALVHTRRSGELWSDITVLLAPETSQAEQETGVLARAARLACEQIRGGHAKLAKIRVAGRSTRPLEERTEAFRRLTKFLTGLETVSPRVWLSDDLLEAPLVEGLDAQVLFFLWDLKRPPIRVREIKEVIGAFARFCASGMLVCVGLRGASKTDVQRHARNLAVVAEFASSRYPAQIRWSLHSIHAQSDVYWEPEVCGLTNLDAHQRRWEVAAALRPLGIHLRVPLNPFHLHGGCPYDHPNACIFDWRGRIYKCLFGAEPPPAGRPAQPCVGCGLLPLCAGECPKWRGCQSRKVVLLNRLRHCVES